MIDYGVNVPKYIECIPDSLFVTNIEYGERKLKTGIILPKEKMDVNGEFVRPRWAKVVYKADNIRGINVGDWILIKHGNWSTSMKMIIDGKETTLWYISPKSYKKGVMAVSEKMPEILREYGINE